jgi:hypothetical protein
VVNLIAVFRIKIALAGVGTFGGDVHLRAYADIRRFGSAGQFARVGLDKYPRELSPVKFDIVAVATRSQKSVEKPAVAFAEWTHPIATIEGQRPDSIPALGNAQGRLPPTEKGLKARHKIVSKCASR